jgi:hypothetical protein
METTLDKIRDIHDTLHMHVTPKGKKDAYGHLYFNHITKCSCGMRWFGEMPENEFQGKIKNETEIHTKLSIIHESEEWVWLGRAGKNIDSNFPQLFQQNRKLWVYNCGSFRPLKTWKRPNSTVWKIAAKRKVPLSIVLENTHIKNIKWVKENWGLWCRETLEKPYDCRFKQKEREKISDIVNEVLKTHKKLQ